MFDFQKLDVYQKSKNFCKEIYSILDEKNFDSVTNDQLRRAFFSIMLNIDEGTSRFSNKYRNFFCDSKRQRIWMCSYSGISSWNRRNNPAGFPGEWAKTWRNLKNSFWINQESGLMDQTSQEVKTDLLFLFMTSLNPH